MPYVIVESKKGSISGYRVRKDKRDPKTGKFHYFSKEPMTLEMAKKQIKALYISESRSK
jgi:hypothetical protein